MLAVDLGVLDEEAATKFLLDRTRGKRAEAVDDAQQARALAHELGGLALGLQQAGAYIAAKPKAVSFAGYLKLWRDNREKALKWFDPKLMGYAHAQGLAATWETSVKRLTPESRPAARSPRDAGALTRFPTSLVDVAVPGEAADYDVLEALAGLYAYSLIAPATAKDGSGLGFVMHRLVQDFARRAMTEERRSETLQEALDWVNAAFVVGNPKDVRSGWSSTPLAPHALQRSGARTARGSAVDRAALQRTRPAVQGGRRATPSVEPLIRRAPAIK